jgi:hypothetical protein
MLLKLIDEPTLMKLKTLTALPKRPKLLTEIDEPSCENPSTLISADTLAIEETLMPEPRRDADRRLTELPRCAKFKTLSADPTLVKLRILNEEPNWANCITETVCTEPTRVTPATEQPEPRRA